MNSILVPSFCSFDRFGLVGLVQFVRFGSVWFGFFFYDGFSLAGLVWFGLFESNIMVP